MFVGVEGEYRVNNVMVGGEPLDLEKIYTLASHNYMLQGQGDGYTIFEDNVYTQESVMLDNQVLITYITEGLGGVVGEAYAELSGIRLSLTYACLTKTLLQIPFVESVQIETDGGMLTTQTATAFTEDSFLLNDASDTPLSEAAAAEASAGEAETEKG